MTSITALLEADIPVAGHTFTALIDEASGAVVAGGFCSVDELLARLRAEQAIGENVRRTPAPNEHPVVRALHRYADGDLRAIDDIPVRQDAPPFRHDVHAALRRIPAGQVFSYSELAAAAGRPTAVRAAGSGCATNLVALIVPCHRVGRSDGTLGSYAYGTGIKEALLRHEGALAG